MYNKKDQVGKMRLVVAEYSRLNRQISTQFEKFNFLLILQNLNTFYLNTIFFITN